VSDCASVVLEPGRVGWPARIDHLDGAAPRRLYVRGTAALGELTRSPSVAIVGARRCSAAGERFARTLAAGLGEAGVAVISGLALGIDAAAHAGALEAGGRTAAVLGCGIDRAYPRRNARLAEAICAQGGALVSEWGPGVEPQPWRFPVRNRLIAALGDATLVVEATRRSGSLHTVDHALALGREVLAVPGSAWSPLGEGVNALLLAGAAPVTTVEDVLDALGLPPVIRRPPDTAPAAQGLAGLVLAALGGQPRAPEALALELGAPAAELQAVLAELLLDGRIVREADGTLALLPATVRRARS
jgi:DNA processing protein